MLGLLAFKKRLSGALNVALLGLFINFVGLGLEGAFRRSSKNNYHLHLNVQNNTGQDLSEFYLKINFNLLGVQVLDQFPSSFFVANGTNVETKIKCSILQGNVNAQEPNGNVIVV